MSDDHIREPRKHVHAVEAPDHSAILIATCLLLSEGGSLACVDLPVASQKNKKILFDHVRREGGSGKTSAFWYGEESVET